MPMSLPCSKDMFHFISWFQKENSFIDDILTRFIIVIKRFPLIIIRVLIKIMSNGKIPQSILLNQLNVIITICLFHIIKIRIKFLNQLCRHFNGVLWLRCDRIIQMESSHVNKRCDFFFFALNKILTFFAWLKSNPKPKNSWEFEIGSDWIELDSYACSLCPFLFDIDNNRIDSFTNWIIFFPSKLSTD